MKKTIISALLGATMISGIANATLVSNGGNPTHSLTEIQANLDSGKWFNYPGVIRDINGVRFGPATAGKYLFAKTFTPGMALPEIHDRLALQKAIADKGAVLVASNDWIVPVPAVFVELGRQNGVSGVDFMAHYLESTAGIDSDAFGQFAEAQTKAVLNVINVEEVTINTKVLIESGISQAQVDALTSSARTSALAEAQEIIDGLNMAHVAELAKLSAQLTAIDNTIHATEQAAFAAGFDSRDSAFAGLERARDEAVAASRDATNVLINVASAVGIANPLDLAVELNTGLHVEIDTKITELRDQVNAAKAAGVTFSQALQYPDYPEYSPIITVANVPTTNADAIADYNRGFAAGAASITPEDGVSQADVDSAIAAVKADRAEDSVYSVGYAAGVASVVPTTITVEVPATSIPGAFTFGSIEEGLDSRSTATSINGESFTATTIGTLNRDLTPGEIISHNGGFYRVDGSAAIALGGLNGWAASNIATHTSVFVDVTSDVTFSIPTGGSFDASVPVVSTHEMATDYVRISVPAHFGHPAAVITVRSGASSSTKIAAYRTASGIGTEGLVDSSVINVPGTPVTRTVEVTAAQDYANNQLVYTQINSAVNDYEAITAQIEAAFSEGYDQGYNEGYADGYSDGYADGFADGSATN